MPGGGQDRRERGEVVRGGLALAAAEHVEVARLAGPTQRLLHGAQSLDAADPRVRETGRATGRPGLGELGVVAHSLAVIVVVLVLVVGWRGKAGHLVVGAGPIGEVALLVAEGLFDASAVAAQDGALVADLGEDQGAGGFEAAGGVIGGAELGAAQMDVLRQHRRGQTEQATRAGVVGDWHALHEEQLHALLGDLDGAVERDVRDVLEQQALGLAIARTDDERLALLADEGARARHMDHGAVVPSGEDAPDRMEFARGGLGLERVVLVGEANAV